MEIDPEIEDCSICGVELTNEFCHKLPCGHIFHYECLLKTLINTRKSNHKSNYCPYCRKPFTFLPIINGLKKITLGVHISHQDYYNNKGLNTIYSHNLNYLQNKPCKAILKKGNRQGELCGKKCKLGQEYCGTHLKCATILNKPE